MKTKIASRKERKERQGRKEMIATTCSFCGRPMMTLPLNPICMDCLTGMVRTEKPKHWDEISGGSSQKAEIAEARGGETKMPHGRAKWDRKKVALA